MVLIRKIAKPLCKRFMTDWHITISLKSSISLTTLTHIHWSYQTYICCTYTVPPSYKPARPSVSAYFSETLFMCFEILFKKNYCKRCSIIYPSLNAINDHLVWLDVVAENGFFVCCCILGLASRAFGVYIYFVHAVFVVTGCLCSNRNIIVLYCYVVALHSK